MRLIDADMALLDLCGKKCGCVLQECGDNPCDVANLILRQPTIEAQPVKRGKWEWEPGYVGTTARCSACGLSPRGFYSLPKNQIGRLPEYKFCPKCGARMEADEDEQAQ